jgi:hypothetical protein
MVIAMENRTTGTANVVQRVASRHHAPMSMAEAERKRFVELAYQLVRCTEPEEQGRLKEELVRLVLSR